jgi:hypothetical protein
MRAFEAYSDEADLQRHRNLRLNSSAILEVRSSTGSRAVKVLFDVGMTLPVLLAGSPNGLLDDLDFIL